MTQPNPIVFPVDVDDTLLENDRIQDDIRRHLEREFAPACRGRYWAIQEELFTQLGYRNYRGPSSAFGSNIPTSPTCCRWPRTWWTIPSRIASILARWMCSNASVAGGERSSCRTATWSSSPRKVERSGISEAVEGHVLIYIHKEEALADVERRYPARHYVLVDDKLRILAAVKKAWGDRVTTVFPRQGKFARDPNIVASYRAGGCDGRAHRRPP